MRSPRFRRAATDARPYGAHRFDVFGPKVGRRLTLWPTRVSALAAAGIQPASGYLLRATFARARSERDAGCGLLGLHGPGRAVASGLAIARATLVEQGSAVPSTGRGVRRTQ
jgi:hypothetical protein